jgi:DNA-binding PadR family transcriptional regulator
LKIAFQQAVLNLGVRGFRVETRGFAEIRRSTLRPYKDKDYVRIGRGLFRSLLRPHVYSRCKYSHTGYNLPMTSTAKDPQPESLLPLPAATFHILLALAEEDRHGYAIILDVAARTAGELRLSAGTLYRSIQRMLEQGLITETRERPSPEFDDERRRYYRITPLGSRVTRAEVTRLAKLLRLARNQGFAPEKA